ncbi:putative dual-specificity RNA methyltransferase RlmN, partial [Dissostichus eleginoides]
VHLVTILSHRHIPHIPLRLLRKQECSAAAETPGKQSRNSAPRQAGCSDNIETENPFMEKKHQTYSGSIQTTDWNFVDKKPTKSVQSDNGKYSKSKCFLSQGTVWESDCMDPVCRACVVPTGFCSTGLKSALWVYHMSGARKASFRAETGGVSIK